MKKFLEDTLNAIVDIDNKGKEHAKKWHNKIKKNEYELQDEKLSSDDEKNRLRRERDKEELERQERIKRDARIKSEKKKNKASNNKMSGMLTLNKNEVVKGLIYSEILGEPKSLRRR